MLERRLWKLDFVIDPDALTVTGVDPAEVAVTVGVGRDPLQVVVDDALTVQSIERRLGDVR